MDFDLRPHTILLTVSGSRAYGTHHEESDVDLRGTAIPPRRYFLGFRDRFEQADREQDMTAFLDLSPQERSRLTSIDEQAALRELPREAFGLFTPQERRAIRQQKLEGSVYGIRKFFTLAADCNPNILDVLFCRDAELRICTALGERLRQGRRAFLSAAARHRFSGYAFSQLARIERHRRWLLKPPQRAPSRADFGLPEQTLIPKGQLAQALAAVRKKLDEWSIDYGGMEESQKVYVMGQIERYLGELRIGADERWQAAARLLGFSENFIEVAQLERQYLAARKEWRNYQSWLRCRNPRRAALEARFGYDCKHAMHLVRLLKMGLELLRSGRVNVWREDAEELLAIQSGAWAYDELLQWAEDQDAAMTKICRQGRCALPERADKAVLDRLCVALVDEFFGARG